MGTMRRQHFLKKSIVPKIINQMNLDIRVSMCRSDIGSDDNASAAPQDASRHVGRIIMLLRPLIFFNPKTRPVTQDHRGWGGVSRGRRHLDPCYLVRRSDDFPLRLRQ